MALFGKKKPAAKKAPANKPSTKKTNKGAAHKNDAAEIAKKMKAKSDSGECAFC